MRKILLLAAATFVLAACTDVDSEMLKGQKTITFYAIHNYETRATLEADGGALTDLWILDYKDGELVQSVHQTSDQADFGVPKLPISYGSHHIYFVGSRGAEPVLDTSAHKITFGTVRDTFWKDYAINVTASTSSNRAVYLDRVVTRLRMLVNDEVPATISKVHLTISKWFFGLNYTTGAAAAQNVRDVDIAVPASLQGTTGELIVSAYGFSDEDVWNADITLTATSADNSVLGTVTIPDAPFKRNRITQYGGNLFASAGEMGIGLNTEWDTNFEGTW